MRNLLRLTCLSSAAVMMLGSGFSPAYPCHVSDELRAVQGELTPTQIALLSKGHNEFGPIAYELEAAAPCSGGQADIFDCQNVDLLAHLPLDEIGGGSGSDIWAWKDPATGVEYALFGRSNGTSILDVSDPEDPVYIGNLPRQANFSSQWRDIKVYQDHAYVVQDGVPNAGIQVFDLTRLRSVINPPVEFTPDLVYDEIQSAHNIAINEESGFAYAVGSDTCNGGLHIVDIRNPKSPSFAGCFSEDGYTHDAQCVNYTGPDPDYQGREVCFAYNVDTLTIVDVTNKSNPTMVARRDYSGSAYTHQGWLTEDQRWAIMDDELDETFNGHNTRTYVFDLLDLDNPTVSGRFTAEGDAIDHNQFILDGFSYQANYRRGLRVLDVSDPAGGNLKEVAYFDTFPEGDGKSFDGAWSAYPYLESGIVLVSDINRGLFVLRVNLAELSTSGACPGEVTFEVDGVTPNTSVGFAGSLTTGSFSIPGGGCQGTTLGLADPNPIGTATSDSNGRAIFTVDLPAGACSASAQAIDFGNCTVSNVAPVSP